MSHYKPEQSLGFVLNDVARLMRRNFNRRVLEEAQDLGNPLLERVKFLAIVANNLDEFFEVRVAGLIQLQETGRQSSGADQLTPKEQLDHIAVKAHQLVKNQYHCWNDDLLPALAADAP